MTFKSHRCRECGAHTHPSCGSQLSEDYILCHACSWKFAKWLCHWTNLKGRRHRNKGFPGFYEAAGKFNPNNHEKG